MFASSWSLVNTDSTSPPQSDQTRNFSTTRASGEGRSYDIRRQQGEQGDPAHLRLPNPLRLGASVSGMLSRLRFFFRFHHLPQVDRHGTAARLRGVASSKAMQ
jgi:hypothetical protein